MINKIPSELLDTSGAVFYSGKSAWKGSKDLYILGLNPGGDVIRQEYQTLIYHTSKNNIGEKEDWSEYRDEVWNNRLKGSAPFQKRILYLLDNLNLDPAEVPASNVVFKRSRNSAELNMDFTRLANLCWPFHQYVIEKLRIRMILCLGRRSGRFVRSKTNANELIDVYEENNNRKWKTRVYINPKGLKVVEVPHPSWANWLNPNSDPSFLIKQHLK